MRSRPPYSTPISRLCAIAKRSFAGTGASSSIVAGRKAHLKKTVRARTSLRAPRPGGKFRPWGCYTLRRTVPANRMDERLKRGFRIGEFRVEPLSGRVIGPSGAHHIQPKVIDVLLCLAARAGELVERDAIVAQVWGRASS